MTELHSQWIIILARKFIYHLFYLHATSYTVKPITCSIIETIRLSIELSQVRKKCTQPEPALEFRSSQVEFVHRLILLISVQIKLKNFKLVIMGKVRARAQKCESLLIY